MYEKNKDLCKKLLDIFNSISEEENTDRDKALESNLNTFIQIYENASDIIQKNRYDAIKFYGVLFCYFNYYYKNNFFISKNYKILFDIQKHPKYFFSFIILYKHNFLY